MLSSRNGRYIYPILGILLSITTLIFGLARAKNFNTLYFIISVWGLFFVFGYFKVCFGIIPFTIITMLLFSSIVVTGTTGQKVFDVTNVNRALTVSFAVMPGMSIPPSKVINNMRQLKIPKAITLGMMITLNFFPLLFKEMKQIRQAIKTRGVITFFNFKALYRAFLVPLVVRIINISSILSLSVETRAFSLSKREITLYKKEKFKFQDAIFLVLFILIIVLVEVL